MRRARRLFRQLRPRHQSVRLRLTLLYGALFLLSGAGLLGITYLLVSNATSNGFTYVSQNGLSTTVIGPHRSSAPNGMYVQGHGLTPQQTELLASQAVHQRDQQLHELLMQSGVALGIMALISILLGWLVAGRVLRRLSTITGATRQISANNLNERLALDGPQDELKELGDTIGGPLGRLESSFRAQRQFIANASHELRTPLARQRVIVQVALSDPNATLDGLRAAHERVLASGSQQERLIAALLTLARGQAGLDVRRRFDLADVTGRVLDSRQAQADRAGITVHARLSGTPAAGNASLVEQLVTNLVDNALHYNVPGGRVDVVAEQRAGRATLSIVNTGPCVRDEDVARLFQPFQRGSGGRTSRSDGAGLGLSIVQAVASAHDATLDAAPRPNGGLAVSVTFPPGGEHTSNDAETTDVTRKAV